MNMDDMLQYLWLALAVVTLAVSIYCFYLDKQLKHTKAEKEKQMQQLNKKIETHRLTIKDHETTIFLVREKIKEKDETIERLKGWLAEARKK